jgi:hypothetical protein
MPMKASKWTMLCTLVLHKQGTLLRSKLLQIPAQKSRKCSATEAGISHMSLEMATEHFKVRRPQILTYNAAVFQFVVHVTVLLTAFLLSIIAICAAFLRRKDHFSANDWSTLVTW